MSEFWTGELFGKFLIGAAIGLGIVAALPARAHAEMVVAAPAPLVDAPVKAKAATAVFAGGCFWGVEGVFSHVKGVTRVVSGFSGGMNAAGIDYERVSRGDTGFAEAVRVTYDPRVVSYGTLMRVFFSVITDPTTLNRQGPDQGTQYRSALFPTTPEQDKAARAYLVQLGKAGLWNRPIVTRIERYRGFIEAGSEHQDFLRRNPRNPYILRWDAPKLAAFRQMYPALYRVTPSA